MKNKLCDIVITEISDIITFYSPKGRVNKIDCREHFGLSFCTEGQITYTMNGKKYISNRDRAILLPKGSTYMIYGDKTGMFPVINFELLHPLWDEIEEIPVKNPLSYIKDYEIMKSLFLFEDNKPKLFSVFYSVLQRLCTEKDNASRVLAPAIFYLANHYSDKNLTNSYLAEKCNLSEVHFRKLFTERFHLTPKQYIIDTRLERAKQLLSEGGLKINAVADICGFSSPYHFSRCFRQKTGLTPGEYMKQNVIYEI